MSFFPQLYFDAGASRLNFLLLSLDTVGPKMLYRTDPAYMMEYGGQRPYTVLYWYSLPVHVFHPVNEGYFKEQAHNQGFAAINVTEWKI